MELEAHYQHAIRLLHSRREDAAEKLKKKLFEAMGRRYEAPKELCKPEGVSVAANALDATPPDNFGKRDVKFGQSKQSRLLSEADAETRSHSSGAEEIVIDEVAAAERASSLTETGISDIDADEIALDMGISCYVCRLFEVSSNNQLVECQECHNLYHQLCHKPPVTEQEVNDPRSVWYCDRCSKTMKKLEKNPVKPTKPQASLKDTSTSRKSDGSRGKQEAAFFRRLDSFKGNAAKESSGSSTSSKPYSGLAGLAANLSGKATEKSSSLLKDDKSSKAGKRQLLQEAAPEKPVKVKPTVAGEGEAAHDKAARKSKDKTARPERREAADGSGSGTGKDDSLGVASSLHVPISSSPLRRDSAAAERPDSASNEDKKPSKLKSVTPATEAGAKAGAFDKAAKHADHQAAHKDKDDSMHKHKVKKLRKE